MSVFDWLFSRQKRSGGTRPVSRVEPILPAASLPVARRPNQVQGAAAVAVPKPPEVAAPPSPAPIAVPTLVLHAVTTYHGTRLAVARETGQVVHVPEERGPEDGRPEGGGPETCPLFAWLPEARPDVCFMTAGEGAPQTLQIENDPLAAPVVSVLVAPGYPGNVVFRRPLSAFHLCAEPQTDPAAPGHVVANRVALNVWEQFGLVTAPADAAIEAASARLAPLARLFRGPVDGVTILAFLEEDDGAPPLVEAVARLLPPDDLAWLGRRVLGSERALARLGGARAVWTHEALPDLTAWLAGAVPR
ncbi:MAG: hypothetical protein JO264_15130 [Acidisphaera sp.]|nr:hypothetical protein [Acidisphaera sp.]